MERTMCEEVFARLALLEDNIILQRRINDQFQKTILGLEIENKHCKDQIRVLLKESEASKKQVDNLSKQIAASSPEASLDSSTGKHDKRTQLPTDDTNSSGKHFFNNRIAMAIDQSPQWFVENFKISNSGRTIQKRSEGHFWTQFFSMTPFTKQERSQFLLKVNTTQYGSILIGIVTEEGKNSKSSWEDKNSICYAVGNGRIVNEQWHEGGNKILEGSIIKVTVDYQKRKLTWIAENVVLSSFDLPEYFCENSLYLKVQMRDKGDLLEFL